MTAPVGDDLTWLDDLQRAHAAATPGPWEFREVSDGWDGKTLALETIAKEPPHTDGSVSPVGHVLSGWGYDAWGISVSDEDAALIVAAVNAVPTLIAELRKRDAALKRIEALAEEYDDEADGADADAAEYDRAGFSVTGGIHRGRASELRDAANRFRVTAALSPESVTT